MKTLAFRQIHLDFHTGPWIQDVGQDFDAREFAKTLKRANVNSINVFAKCHHGHLYYKTAHPARHPGLKPGLDMLGEQIEALHREGIKAPVYFSVQCDEYAGVTHPDWLVVNADAAHKSGSDVAHLDSPLAAKWHIVDMSSPYQDYMADQVAEILKLFHPVDGLWFDMCWDQPSLNAYAIRGMVKRGFNPELEEDRKRYAHQVSVEYLRRFAEMVRAKSPEALLYFNCRDQYWAEEAPYMAQFEIESLPSGGWGYRHFPRVVRQARVLGRPTLGMTGRFHRSWADFGGIKPYAALEYETSLMISNGAACSVGDQMHPRGVLDRASYDLIGRAYARIVEREEWLTDAEPVTEVALLEPSTGDASSLNGAVRMLTQLKQQFDILKPDAPLDNYKLAVLPDSVRLNEKVTGKLRDWLRRGGKLLASGFSGLSEDGKQVLLPELGVSAQGISPFTATYLRSTKPFESALSEEGFAPETDYVVYDRGLRVTAEKDSETVASVVDPYFERAWNHFCSHRQTPPDRVTEYAGAVLSKNTAYIAAPLFETFAKNGNACYRALVNLLLKRLLPEPLLRVKAYTGTEATLCRQKDRRIVHVLHYSAERRTPDIDLIEDIVPIYDVPVSVRADRSVKQVYLAPNRQKLDFTQCNGRIEFTVPEVNGHAMIVLE
jgi:hypothetical protein